MKPEITAQVGLYVIDWKSEQVTMRVDRLAEDSRFNVTAEVLITHGVTGHLHGPARLNLTSTTSRKTLSTTLRSRVNGIDWYAVVEEACVEILLRYREVEPVIDLSELPPPTSEFSYRVRPLIREGQINMFYGAGGVGKSYLAAYLAVLVTAPLSEAGLTAAPGGVLYLDYETDREDTQGRILRLARGLGIPAPHVYYKQCRQPMAAETQEIQQIIANEGIDLLIIDSASMATSGEVSETKPTKEFFAALRMLNRTSLIIAHTQKNSIEKTPLGSAMWTNQPRQVFMIRSTHEMVSTQQESRQLEIGIYDSKMNSRGHIKPLGFRFAFSDDDVRITAINITDNPDLAKNLPIRDQVAGLLRHGNKLSVEHLSETLEIPQPTIRMVLNRHKDDFVRFGGAKDALWALGTSRPMGS